MNLHKIWLVIRRGWSGPLTATLAIFVFAYVLVVLDHLGLI